ncbi:plasminogen-like [Pecten maximus]|uniref:plasminogen-like n=1 Tax=Pecten maximus TaxID=6579 RepID=UPI0014580C69|nr:plasminogen-like [Pecten maximus]
MEMDGYEYEGRVSCTLKGTVCQRWDTDFPHSLSYYRDRSDYGNSCKIGNEHRPWCYTTDPNDRWDYCPVEDLDCGAPPIISPSNTGVKIEIKWPDMGSKAQVLYQCESLIAAEPDQHCPVARCEGDLNWSEANVSCSVNDCYVHDDSYTGRVSCTITGHPCQRWDSDEPHSHSILEGRSDLENWCQIDGEDKPWCYTTSTRVRWDYCPVRECP